MPTLIAPIWLFGLLTIPLIWWLHHYRCLDSSTMVSAAWLWRGNAIAQGSHMQRTVIDPSWRIRALAAGMLVIGLAGPLWLTQSPRSIVIWFDDSISMQTLENGTSRTTLATNTLFDLLPINQDSEVTLRSLTDISRSLKLAAGQQLTWRSSIEKWIKPGHTLFLPTPQQMNTDHVHWLVSDGADLSIGAWLEKARLNRIVQVGENSENVALTHLSLRPSLARSGTHRGLLIVHNLGHETATRHIEIKTDRQTVKAIDISIPAGKDVSLPFRLSYLQGGRISAVMKPDALQIDDKLTLETTPGGKISTTLDPTCGPHLRKAVQAHPNLRFIERTQHPTMVISCAEKQPRSDGRLLWIHIAQSTKSLLTGSIRNTPLWQPDAGPLQKLSLNSRWLRRYEIGDDDKLSDNFSKPINKYGNPLLIAGGTPLVIDYQPAQALLEVRLDLESPQLVVRPEYPLLIVGLVDSLLKRSSLDSIWHIGRSPQQSIIAPSNMSVALRSNDAGVHRVGNDLSFFFILTAGLLLLLDFMRTLGRPLPMASVRLKGQP